MAIAFAVLVLIGFLFPALSGRIERGVPQEKRTVSQLIVALRQYQTEFGAVPAGDAAQILAVLRGQNERQIVFYETQPSFVNPKGELIDKWGTPYRFELSDPQNPRIWSCGKDRRDDGGAEGSDDISWR